MVVAADIREIGGREIDVGSPLLFSFSFWWSVFLRRFFKTSIHRQSPVGSSTGRTNQLRVRFEFFLRSIPNNIRETMMLGIYNRGSQNFVVGE